MSATAALRFAVMPAVVVAQQSEIDSVKAALEGFGTAISAR